MMDYINIPEQERKFMRKGAYNMMDGAKKEMYLKSTRELMLLFANLDFSAPKSKMKKGKKSNRRVMFVEPVGEGPAKESSEEDLPEPVKKPKKVQSGKSDEKHKAKKGYGKKPKEVEIAEEETEPKPVKKPKTNKVRSDEKTEKKQSRK
jgi:hypothetical protein